MAGGNGLKRGQFSAAAVCAVGAAGGEGAAVGHIQGAGRLSLQQVHILALVAVDIEDGT